MSKEGLELACEILRAIAGDAARKPWAAEFRKPTVRELQLSRPMLPPGQKQLELLTWRELYPHRIAGGNT